MEVLTGDTLAEALLFCSQQENVSVCVVLDNMRNTKELVEILWREIELGNLPGWVMQRGFDVASFSNTYPIHCLRGIIPQVFFSEQKPMSLHLGMK
jgi:hypothetical protein